MLDSVTSPPTSTTSRWPAGGAPAAPRQDAQRLRRALLVMLALLAGGVLLAGAAILRLEAGRAAEAQTAQRAADQRVWAQALATEAALLAADAAGPTHGSGPSSALERLAASVAQASQWTPLLAADTAAGWRTETPAAVKAAVLQWEPARDRLLQRAQALLAEAQGASVGVLPGAVGDAASPGSRAERLLSAAAAVQAEATAAQPPARQLARVLADAAQAQADRQRQQLLWAGVALGGLLVLLVMGVLEPQVRRIARRLEQLARQSEDVQRLALVAEHTTAIVVITDTKDRIEWVNTAFTRVCGWTLAEAQGQRPQQLLSHPREDKPMRTREKQALVRGEGLRHEWLRRARDGRDLWLDIDLRPLTNAAGVASGFVRVASDVTLRVQQQAKLQALWTAMPAGVVVQSAAGDIQDANRAAERILGLSVADMRALGAHDARWRAVQDDLSELPLAQHPAMRTLQTGQALANQTLGLRTPDGALRWLLMNTEPQRDMQGQVSGVITCFIDITESRELQRQLQAHARTDLLTQLPNRAVVMERLQRAILHALRHPGYGFALLFMDFDRFKQVNDTLGHSAGDALLRQIAQRLQEVLRPGDAVARLDGPSHVAARIGGDEFVVVLDGVDSRQNASVVAERLLRELSLPYQVGSAQVQSGVSIGVVAYGGEDALRPVNGLGLDDVDEEGEPNRHQVELEAEALLRNADTAMYEAKRAGRGRWVLFDDSMHERVVRALAVETDLRRAIKEDELYVVYQPVMDLATRMMVGVEALVRWRHPERGLVPPADFIAIAEECGLIDAVGVIVLRKACRQFVRWQRSLGTLAPRQLAVNLSRAQLQRPTVVQDVRGILHDEGMPADRLQLEVTESLAAQDDAVQATLRELKSLGVKLALDDFGTGYSSLACLHLMPVDTVKVDRSFVRHAETVEYHRVLIEATIRVARTLGMSTVAEGIETEGQAELMKRLDCDRGQGYLYARPLEVADMESWVRNAKGGQAQVMLAAG